MFLFTLVLPPGFLETAQHGQSTLLTSLEDLTAHETECKSLILQLVPIKIPPENTPINLKRKDNEQ